MVKIIELTVKRQKYEDLQKSLFIAKQEGLLLEDECLMYACPKFCACMDEYLKKGDCHLGLK